jgi:hypothetical protein
MIGFALGETQAAIRVYENFEARRANAHDAKPPKRAAKSKRQKK